MGLKVRWWCGNEEMLVGFLVVCVLLVKGGMLAVRSGG
jgi:hypothetical protein